MTANVLAAPSVRRISRDGTTTVVLKSCTVVLRKVASVLQTMSSATRIKGIAQWVVAEITSLVCAIPCSTIRHDRRTGMSILPSVSPFFLPMFVHCASEKSEVLYIFLQITRFSNLEKNI